MKKSVVYRSICYCLVFLSFSSQANHIGYSQAKLDAFFANKIVIINNSGFSVDINMRNEDYGMRMADKTFKLLFWNMGLQDIGRFGGLGVDILEFGHSQKSRAIGQRTVRVSLSQIWEDARQKGLYRPGQALFIIISKPTPFTCRLVASCSDWTKSIEYAFDIPSTRISVSLPGNENPYDLQDLKGVKDLVESGKYSSVEDFKRRANVRWARVFLGLPKKYTKKSIYNAYWRIVTVYSSVIDAKTPEQKQWVKNFTQVTLMDPVAVLMKTIKEK